MNLKKIYDASFNFGQKVLPKIFKMAGMADDKTANISGHGTIWTGFLLGAGGALVAVGAAIGLLSGGAIIAPTLLGSALLSGALGVVATAVGTALFRSGAEVLGISFFGTVKNFFKSLFTKKDAEKTSTTEAATSQGTTISLEEATTLLNKIADLGESFKKAVKNNTPQPTKPFKPAFGGPNI